MSVQVCKSCRGQKKVIGLGMMEKTCESCKGIGWIEAEVEPQLIPTIEPTSVANVEINTAELTIKPEKRRGRPAKV